MIVFYNSHTIYAPFRSDGKKMWKKTLLRNRNWYSQDTHCLCVSKL